MTIQDHAPNFRDQGQLFLVRCYRCGRENYAPAVATGTCAFCGWRETDGRMDLPKAPEPPELPSKTDQKKSRK